MDFSRGSASPASATRGSRVHSSHFPKGKWMGKLVRNPQKKPEFSWLEIPLIIVATMIEFGQGEKCRAFFFWLFRR
ncbi:hypothetical protein [Persicirhabdus sediminis]|uniref:hypothetical protein n=1 Tax=Persicirhabdus sediminis TaxID=454144 RepID=UPI001F2DFCB2|nr:hypothetical protein [Persicirhabdus sediminis]